MSQKYYTQNELLLSNLLDWYNERKNLDTMLNIINGKSKISLRIVDWFTTNYAKKNFIIYNVNDKRFNVYLDYKLKLKAYSKRRFDPFCRWDRITIPYHQDNILTTIGQLNFFKWAIENKIIEYIITHYDSIEKDMNSRNTTVSIDKTKEITYEKGCKITFKCDPKTMKNEVFEPLKERVNIDCAYVSVYSYYNGCIYDLYRESNCPGSCKKNNKLIYNDKT